MRKKLIGFFLFACVSAALMIPAFGLGQQRGDPTQQGGKGGKKGKGGQGDVMPGQAGVRASKGPLNIGGMNVDANAIFDQLAKGQDTVLISNSGQMATPLQQWALDNGNTSGRVNRQQFSGFVQSYAAGLQAAMGGQGKGAKGGDPDAAAAQRFKTVDKNGDGFISQDEMSAQAKDTGVWKKFDSDGDGKLNLAEYLNFTRERVVVEQALKMSSGAKGTAGLYEAMVGGMKDVKVVKVEDTEWEKLPVVYRPGKLPPNIPAWFVQLDADKDAQIGLYEWRISQKPVVEFQVMDRNGDSLLTADEFLWHMKAIASLNGPGMTTAAYSQSQQGMQGFPSGGFGGFNNGGFGGFNKGGFGGFNNQGKGGFMKGDFGGSGPGGGKKGKKGGG